MRIGGEGRSAVSQALTPSHLGTAHQTTLLKLKHYQQQRSRNLIPGTRTWPDRALAWKQCLRDFVDGRVTKIMEMEPENRPRCGSWCSTSGCNLETRNPKRSKTRNPKEKRSNCKRKRKTDRSRFRAQYQPHPSRNSQPGTSN